MKKNILKPIFVIILSVSTLFILYSCFGTSTTSTTASSPGAWLIPVDEVYDGGPGKDGIPALTDPTMISADEATFLKDDDLVIGVVSNGDIRAYPHMILDWHEIINDTVIDDFYAVTYCPLTGTGIVWDRMYLDSATTYGVSGLLYNTNLIPYDRATDSYWSQMLRLCVHGKRIGEQVTTSQVIETTWKTWRASYPETKVVSTNTGYERPYGSYPYGDYRTNDSFLLFPISYDDPRLPRKERVHGIYVDDSHTKVYQISRFGDSLRVLHDRIGDQAVVVVGSSALNLVLSFSRVASDGSLLTFTAVQDSLPVILRDEQGNEYDLSGTAVTGPDKGNRLKSTESFNAYWFAWGTFFRDAEIADF